MDSLLEQMLDSPRLRLYYDEIAALLADEQRRREAFYARLGEDDKAEFINGVVVVHAPVRLIHNTVGTNLLVLLQACVQRHNLGAVGYERLLIALTRNDYEPDICFFGQAKARQFLPDQVRFPAPDFVVEILSPSTKQTDRTTKFDDYAAHGVAEYWIIDPEAETVEQYTLDGTEQRYRLQHQAQTGNLQSHAVPGFTIPIRAIFDSAEQSAALQQLLATPAAADTNRQ